MKTATAHNGHAAWPDRLPPQNLEAERGVLGSALLDNEVLHDVTLTLAVSDFYRDVHQTIYQVIREMYGDGKGIDAITLADELIRRDQFAKIGGDETLAEIINSVPHAANACYYAGIVREKAVGRHLIEACTGILRRCYSNQFTAADLMCEAEEQILALGDRDAGDSTASYADVMGEVMARMAIREQDRSAGTPSGFRDLDGVTGGFRPGELTIIAARPGMGKTSLALDAGENVARGQGGHAEQQVLLFSIEMGREALGDRIITGEAGVDSDRFRAAWVLEQAEKLRITKAAARLSGLPMHVDFSPSRTVAQITAQARRHRRRHGLGLVIVDYVQLIKGMRSGGESREQVVAEISAGLKQLARSLCIPVVALAQLNREVEKRTDKTPQLADLRESGAIEQDADVVLLLWRPEYYDEHDRPGVAELVVAKNRNGRTGIVTLAFVANCTRFDSVARGPAGMPLSDDTSF